MNNHHCCLDCGLPNNHPMTPPLNIPQIWPLSLGITSIDDGYYIVFTFFLSEKKCTEDQMLDIITTTKWVIIVLTSIFAMSPKKHLFSLAFLLLWTYYSGQELHFLWLSLCSNKKHSYSNDFHKIIKLFSKKITKISLISLFLLWL